MGNDSETVGSAEPTSEQACSVCGSSEVVDGPLDIGPVCVDCGTVAATEIATGVLDSMSGDESRNEDWTDHYSVRNSTEQQVAAALEFLETLGDRLDAPRELRERAAELYGEAAVEMTTDGRSTESIVAGVLIIAGRELERPHPVGRMAELAEIDVGQLRRSLSALRSDLGHFYPPCPPRAYLPELARILELDDSKSVTADRLLEELPASRIGGRYPAAVAGAALYLAADGETTQREVALVTGVTTETVRLRVKECREVWPIQTGTLSSEGEQP